MVAKMTPHPTRKSLEQIEDARLNAEKQTVLAQPHRRGERGHMTDNFGTFLRFAFGPHEQDQMRRCWEAGQSYIVKTSNLRRAEGLPGKAFLLDDDRTSTGGEHDQSIIDDLKKQIDACKNAMKCSGLPAFTAAENLILEDKIICQGSFAPIKRAIINLAICLGFIS